jgi:hypothetical protein
LTAARQLSPLLFLWFFLTTEQIMSASGFLLESIRFDWHAGAVVVSIYQAVDIDEEAA